MSEDLSRRSIRALLWFALGTGLKLFSQIFSQIVIARLVGPTEYGLFSFAYVVILLTSFVADFGLTYALIQRDSVTEQDVRFLFTWQVIFGFTVALLLWTLATPIALWMGELRLAPVMSGLALVCVFTPLGAASLNLLKRELRFREISLAQSLSYTVGYVVVGIPLAYLGFGVWSMVVAALVNTIGAALFQYLFARHSVRPLFQHPEAAALFRFGGVVVATNFLNWMLTSTDRTAVGRLSSARSLGLYSVAFNLVSVPANALAGMLQPVLYSACARAADDKVRLGVVYLGIVRGLALLLFPIFAGIAAAAQPLVKVLYGDAWTASGDILVPAALAVPFLLMGPITTPILWTAGHHRHEFQRQIPVAIVWIPMCIWLAGVSPLAVAWGGGRDVRLPGDSNRLPRPFNSLA